ncbi:DUF6880 family protein [Methylobacterium sp. WL64]|uniref:DUF6880 family protein n=1 Tax=Methylobacterium sp. WL64 TaxID=2603894 RepID=UPI0034D34695
MFARDLANLPSMRAFYESRFSRESEAREGQGMARRATLTTDTLVALGAERLSRLVLDEAGRNAPFKKLVTAALAGAKLDFGQLGGLAESVGPGWRQTEPRFPAVAFAT